MRYEDLIEHSDGKSRCGWAGHDQLYVHYHDTEWGVPVLDDQKLFEFLILEGAQAGLSWLTILKRREGYREAFCQFDAQKVAKMNESNVEELMQNERIIRNRAKIKAAITNAKVFLSIVEEFGSFTNYQWSFIDGGPIQNKIKKLRDLQPRTEISDAFSHDLKKRGMNFVGSTIIYAHMQATGMVNDHLIGCHRYFDVLNHKL